MFETHREQLLRSLDKAHDAYYRAETFGGPSLYFHLRTLDARKNASHEQFAESSYAVLTAWGMHRMGSRGSKMVEFDIFKDSLEPLWPKVSRLQQISPENICEADWQEMGEIFRGIRCMRTKSSLVGNSKVMAHALPNLVPPIDREYTLQFLFGSKNVANNPEREWETLEQTLQHFFYPILRAESFKVRATEWGLRQATKFKWDTSPLKIADNLVIGLLRSKRVPVQH